MQGPGWWCAVPSWLHLFVAEPVPIWVPAGVDSLRRQEAGTPASSCPSVLMEEMSNCFLLLSSSQEMSCLLMSERHFCASQLITQVLQISSDEFSRSPVLTLQVSFRGMRGLCFFEHSCGKSYKSSEMAFQSVLPRQLQKLLWRQPS